MRFGKNGSKVIIRNKRKNLDDIIKNKKSLYKARKCIIKYLHCIWMPKNREFLV